MPDGRRDELAELISFPSVSADPANADDVRRAAEWVRDFITSFGGEAELVETATQPLVIGRGDGVDEPRDRA